MDTRDYCRDPIRVLLSVPPPRPTTNPYIVMLAEALRSIEGIEVMHFDWRVALTGDYDVLHVHWPETLTRGSRLPRTALRHSASAALVARLRMRGTPVVRTLHNIDPHEPPPPITRRILNALDGLTVATISLNPATPPLRGLPNVVIPHGHYRTWFAQYPAAPSRAGTMVSFGAIRPYKNLPELVAVVRGMPDPDLRLDIAGPAPDPVLVQSLSSQVGDDSRIHLRPQFIEDGELVAMVTGCQVVVLPYREMHNSGAALAALSLGRPVLVPANEVTEDLATEVGPGWVHRYTGHLTAEAVRAALADRRPEGALPDLRARDWHQAGERHAQVYREALRTAAGARRSVGNR